MGLLAFLVQIVPAMNAVHLGGTVTFTCDVTVPEPLFIHNYTWTAPESVVRDGRYRLLDNRRVLMILDVTYEEDNGYATCNAFLSNGNKGRAAQGTIRVVPPGEDLPTTKRIIPTTTIPTTTVQKTTSKPSTPGVTSRNPSTTINVKPQPTVRLTPRAVPIPSTNPPSVTSFIQTTSKITTEDFNVNTSEVDISTDSTMMPDDFVPPKERGTNNNDEGQLVPSISAGGAVIAVLGFIIVAVIMFLVIRYLRKDNEKVVMGIKRNRGGSSTRGLMYSHRRTITNEVSTYDEPSKETQRNDVHNDSNNSSPGRERMYTPKTNNGSTKHLKAPKQSDSSYEDMKSPTASAGKNSFGTAYEQMSRSSNQKRAYKTASNYSILSATSYDNITPASVHSEDELRNSSGASSENSFKSGRASQDTDDNDIPEYSKVRKPDRNANVGLAKSDDGFDYEKVHESIARSLTPMTAV